MTSSDLRASDVERAEAVEQLSRERTVISVDELDGARTALTVYGTAPRAVRKAFAELGRWPRSFSSAGA